MNVLSPLESVTFSKGLFHEKRAIVLIIGEKETMLELMEIQSCR